MMELRTSRLKTFLWILMIWWTGIVFGLFLLDSRHLTRTVKDLAIAEATAYLNKDQASRLWAASHGGVYVPISEKTQPNPISEPPSGARHPNPFRQGPYLDESGVHDPPGNGAICGTAWGPRSNHGIKAFQ